jgi:hypothetical protein
MQAEVMLASDFNWTDKRTMTHDRTPHLNSFKGILAHWATLWIFAEQMGVPLSTVKNWSTENSIPPTRWDKLIEVAAAWGIELSLPLLNRLYLERQEPRARISRK